MTDAQENALADATGESLAALFDKDPLELSDKDIERMVDEMRKHRTKWMQEEQQAKSKGKKKKEKPNLDLDNLDLEL